MNDKVFDLPENNDKQKQAPSEDEINEIINHVSSKENGSFDEKDVYEVKSEPDDELLEQNKENEKTNKKKDFELNIQFDDDFSDEADSQDELNEEVDYVRKKKKKKVQGANNSVFGGLLLIIIIVALSVLIAMIGITVGKDMLGFGDSSNTITINIPEGASTSEIAQILEDEGIIKYSKVFLFIAKLRSSDGQMYPGDVELSANMSYEAILKRLSTMREEKPTVRLTFVEGITIYEAAQMLEENGVCDADEFIYTFNNTVYGYDFEDMVTTNKLEFYKMEGYLYPDTYEFYLDDSAFNVAKKFKAEFASSVNYNMLDRVEQLGYTLDEVITLASIVQMEAGDPSEMKTVASVFINRLNNPMEYPRLQSDTTDNYVDKVIKPNSSIDYQEMYDAYDTYIGTGLPPGAICNPGLDAINAVLYSDDTDYYYFCSNLDTREFYYAKTLTEHNENLKLAGLA